jgi:hypothetical protein
MDLALFAATSAIGAILCANNKNNDKELCYVDQDNNEWNKNNSNNNDTPGPPVPPSRWYRATYILVMHEPPHLFYEPKDWSHTSVLLLRVENDNQDSQKKNYVLPGGPVLLKDESSCQDSAIRSLNENVGINVCLPENCLHHLFTFPFANNNDDNNNNNSGDNGGGIWGDFYECVFRGKLQDLHTHNKKVVTFSLAQLFDMMMIADDDKKESNQQQFTPDAWHALLLYFQRQGDLQAKRRLLKGYSSVDLDHYGLRSSSKPLILRMDSNYDTQRNLAVEYTMQTDDGMSPRLLNKAEVVLLGVSRAGKTPLSILMAQTMGLKVANIPLVLELPPPPALLDHTIMDPRRVFCLTMQPEYLATFRRNRFQREMKRSNLGPHCTYADVDYVRRDVENARKLARDHGFTEIDVTGRAMEETATLIVSKLKERFPEMH